METNDTLSTGSGRLQGRSGGFFTRLGQDTLYAMTAMPLGLAGFVLTVVGVALGLGTLVIWIGIPILGATVLASSGLAQLERLRLRKLQGRVFPAVHYRGGGPSQNPWVRALRRLRDPQSWLDLVWGVVGFVSGLVAFVVVTVWWAASLTGLTYWFWERWIPRSDDDEPLAELLGLGDGRTADVTLTTVIGLVALVSLPFVVRAVAWLHASLASVLLNSRAELLSEVRRAEGAREAAHAAEAVSLRRLERDIHDGPQQRLVRMDMDLGRARRQLADNPDGAAEILAHLQQHTRETVNELRALSRGIAPPLLVDRGLAVALDELAARSAVEVDLHRDLPAALPPEVETAVYFTVSEALTNAAKHAGVDRARVRVVVDRDAVVAEVTDAGQGGAHPGKGQGLAGLQQRLTAVGGTLDVHSPNGGPTTVRARVPLT
ncbi:sensor histidine kinase [Nocardioides alcanivorans]|uniref:sensor histidine kinase n=1 Tax=Nocardioides alcanivorans TaxID=2897352 RepID=UPI001F31ABAE|nr:sensor histidine kinase [Nocardioides alcanivorans]